MNPRPIVLSAEEVKLLGGAIGFFAERATEDEFAAALGGRGGVLRLIRLTARIGAAFKDAPHESTEFFAVVVAALDQRIAESESECEGEDTA